MTVHHPPTCQPRRLTITAALAAISAMCLLAAGCGGSTTSASTSSSSEAPASTSSGGDAARETAETHLEVISTKLGTVLTEYGAGKAQQAYTLAKSISANLYEGTTEGIVSRDDPGDDRQIDSLLAATLPAAINSKESASQVDSLIHRAQALAGRCLAAIHGTE